jgi:hypothetical protein
MSLLIFASVIVKSTSLIGSEFLRGALLTVAFQGILKLALETARTSKIGLWIVLNGWLTDGCHQVMSAQAGQKKERKKKRQKFVCKMKF